VIQGIVYLLCGMKAAERLVVSIHTLRNHWDGSIAILTTTKEEQQLARRIASDLSCQVLLIQELGNRAMLAKTFIPDYTPYEETLFLDADTVVIGRMDEMFGYPLTLTQFAKWVSNKRFTEKWIRQWKEHVKREDFLDMIQMQLDHPYPALNTGVFAFRRDNANLVLWKTLAGLFPTAKMIDQTAMQILTSTIPHRIMDDRFNNSAIHGHETVDVRLIHFHGGKRHCSDNEYAMVWKESFRKAIEANVGGLKEWAGTYDRRVRKLLAEDK